MPRSCKRDWFTSHKKQSKTNRYHLCLESRGGGGGGGGGFRKLQCPLAEFRELLQGNLSHQVESVVGLWMHLMDCSDCSIASQRNHPIVFHLALWTVSWTVSRPSKFLPDLKCVQSRWAPCRGLQWRAGLHSKIHSARDPIRDLSKSFEPGSKLGAVQIDLPRSRDSAGMKLGTRDSVESAPDNYPFEQIRCASEQFSPKHVRHAETRKCLTAWRQNICTWVA